MGNKLMTFKHTKDGMLTVENQNGDYILKNEFLGVLHELISEKERVLANYSSEDDPIINETWFKINKAEFEAQLDMLEKLKSMVY